MSIFARQKSSSEEADRKKRLTMPLIYRMYESQSEEFCGSVRGPDDDDFHPEEASKSLRQALAAGIQSHDKTLIDVLLAHNNFQRQKIATAYENMYARRKYGHHLMFDLQNMCSGDFLRLLSRLVNPPDVASGDEMFSTV
uniref:Annexin n=1 Tax=Globodera pallida TaxID=36090 RepID=A0A183BZL8_GLOPA